MIDYEKLKLAHELAEKAGSKIHYAYQNKEGNHVSWVDLDQLLLEMQELTQPKPKYEVGQIVFTRYDKDIHEFKIDEIIHDGEYWYLHYTNDGAYSDGSTEFDQYREDIVYPSREALIDAQIEYWKGMKQEKIIPIDEMKPTFEGEIKGFNDKLQESCQHENNGFWYFEGEEYSKFFPATKHVYPSPVLKLKCKKCGEFYR